MLKLRNVDVKKTRNKSNIGPAIQTSRAVLELKYKLDSKARTPLRQALGLTSEATHVLLVGRTGTKRSNERGKLSSLRCFFIFCSEK